MILELAHVRGRQRDMARIGGHQRRTRACGAVQRLLEIQRLQVARDITWRIGIGDILRQHILALMQPGHAFAQHCEKRYIGQIHGGNLLLALKRPDACARHA